MKICLIFLFSFMIVPSLVLAQASDTSLTVDFTNHLGPMKINRFSLGQTGDSSESMFADRTAEIRTLRPRVIRLFVQEYFDLLPEPGSIISPLWMHRLTPFCRQARRRCSASSLSPKYCSPALIRIWSSLPVGKTGNP